MCSFFEVFFRFWSSIIFSAESHEELDPKNLRIRIPKCTYVMCDLCKDTYIKEHLKGCQCLKPNDN